MSDDGAHEVPENARLDVSLSIKTSIDVEDHRANYARLVVFQRGFRERTFWYVLMGDRYVLLFLDWNIDLAPGLA